MRAAHSSRRWPHRRHRLRTSCKTYPKTFPKMFNHSRPASHSSRTGSNSNNPFNLSQALQMKTLAKSLVSTRHYSSSNPPTRPALTQAHRPAADPVICRRRPHSPTTPHQTRYRSPAPAWTTHHRSNFHFQANNSYNRINLLLPAMQTQPVVQSQTVYTQCHITKASQLNRYQILHLNLCWFGSILSLEAIREWNLCRRFSGCWTHDKVSNIIETAGI